MSWMLNFPKRSGFVQSDNCLALWGGMLYRGLNGSCRLLIVSRVDMKHEVSIE